MNTILVIQAHPGVEDVLERHWPFWNASGATLFGMERIGAMVKWPERIPSVASGLPGYVNGDNLPRRLVASFREALDRFPEATSICVIEYDCLVLKPLVWPEGPYRQCLISHQAGGSDEGFKSSQYFHCPWFCDRGTAVRIANQGMHLIKFTREIEQGFPDRFMGLIVDRLSLRVTPANSYSRNALDTPQYLEEARQARKNGVSFIHGIKNKEMFDAVMKD